MPRNIAYYLSKGFDKPMAEYFASGRQAYYQCYPEQRFYANARLR